MGIGVKKIRGEMLSSQLSYWRTTYIEWDKVTMYLLHTVNEHCKNLSLNSQCKHWYTVCSIENWNHSFHNMWLTTGVRNFNPTPHAMDKNSYIVRVLVCYIYYPPAWEDPKDFTWSIHFYSSFLSVSQSK